MIHYLPVDYTTFVQKQQTLDDFRRVETRSEKIKT